MRTCNVEIEKLVEKLLHVESIENQVLGEWLDFPKPILTGWENFVNALYYVVGDHTWDTLNILGSQVLGFEGACSLQHIYASSQISLWNVN